METMRVELLTIAVLVAFTGSTTAISGWTIWFDISDPTSGHDTELLADIYGLYPTMVCLSPVLIQAETTAGVPALDTNQVLRTFDANLGLECYDTDQPGYPFSQACEDYKVRFFCDEGPPVMTSHPSSKTRLVGESVTFCCSAHGTPQPYSYEWFQNGDVLPKTVTDNATLILHHLTTSDAGEYRCRANSDAGAVYSKPATLTIHEDVSQQCDVPEPYHIQLPRDSVQPDSARVYYIEVSSLNKKTGQWLFENDFFIDQSKNRTRSGQQFVFASTTITSSTQTSLYMADSRTICYVKVRAYNSRDYDENEQADGVSVTLITQNTGSTLGIFETKITAASKGVCIPTQCQSNVNIYGKAEKDGRLFSVARNDELGFSIPNYETSPDGKAFKINLPFPSGGGNGPMYRSNWPCGSSQWQCENSPPTDKHFRFYTNFGLFEDNTISTEACRDRPDYLCWNPDESFNKKSCYIKVRLTGTGLEGATVSSLSKVGTHKTAQPSIQGQLYGIREDVALPNGPDSPNTKAVCIEYKCSGQLWTTDSAGRPFSDPVTDKDYTLVEVTVTPGSGATHCDPGTTNALFQSTQSVLQTLVDAADWPTNTDDNKFRFLADQTSTGHFFGVYHGNGVGEVGKTEAYEKCLHGDGGISRDMTPDAGYAITFNCL